MNNYSTEFVNAMDQIKEDIHQLMREITNRPLCIAIDGMSGSGKSTLGELLAEEFASNLFHMDDYFLRPEQRTENRRKEIGGNVDYERFYQEIISPILLQKETIQYRTYHCKSGILSNPLTCSVNRINIVEGSYSKHPYFGDCYDYSIFIEVSEKEQTARIQKRNGEAMLLRFLSEWIPKENAYFETFHIREASNLILDSCTGRAIR